MKKQQPYKMDDDLLMRYFTGELSGQESEALGKSLEADPSKREYLERMEKLWNLSGSIQDFQSIDTAKDWNTLRKKFGSSEISGQPDPWKRTISLTHRLIRIAAIILLVFGSAFMLYYYTGNGPISKLDWITVTVEDQQQELNLPDGSRVYLNNHSSLIYPADFKGLKRTVKLDGEAFFEIERDVEKAFVVNVADDASVEILGTSFNLRTDPEKKHVFLYVLTGKVAFYPKGKKKQARVVKQDEQAMYHKGKISPLSSIDLNFLSWRTRTLVFENTPLTDVVEQLGRHYRKEFLILDVGLDTLALTGTYNNQKIEEVLEEIALVLDIYFEETDGMIQVTAYDVQTDEE